jgi:hypothetical protein
LESGNTSTINAALSTLTADVSGNASNNGGSSPNNGGGSQNNGGGGQGVSPSSSADTGSSGFQDHLSNTESSTLNHHHQFEHMWH